MDYVILLLAESQPFADRDNFVAFEVLGDDNVVVYDSFDQQRIFQHKLKRVLSCIIFSSCLLPREEQKKANSKLGVLSTTHWNLP